MPTPYPTVLVVEDEVDHAHLIGAVFASRALGAHVDLVESGGAAVAYLEAASPDELPDVVILDLGLPDISGFEVLEWISERRELKDLPVLVFSTSTDPKAVERAYVPGEAGRLRGLGGRGTGVPGALERRQPGGGSVSVKPSARFLSQARVLVVDDEPAVRSVVRQTLERYGWKVLEAETSREAVALVEKFDDPLDLAVVDLMLDGEEAGLVLARTLLKARPRFPVLFMSGYTDLEARLEEMPEVPTDFIGKPMSITELIRKASALVTKGPPRARQDSTG